MKKINKRWILVIIGVMICAVIFLWSTVFYKVFSTSDIKSEITGTLLGTIISAIVTVLLLQGQTEIEEGKDISLNVFAKKQTVYFEFIDCLKKITKDGKINIPGTKEYNPSDEDELQDLIYELGKVQMTASEETSSKVTKQVGEVLKIINGNEANKAALYSTFAGELFKLVGLLRIDLYGEESNSTLISKELFEETLILAGFGEELEKNKANVKAVKDFLDFTSKALKDSFNLSCEFLINGVKKETSKDAADIFVQTEKCLIQICFQKKDGKYVWIEFYPTGCQYGIRQRKLSGSWGGWDTGSKKINKQVALKDLSFVETFNEMHESEKKEFISEFIASFENFEKFLNS